jgi:hypothetical protein
LERLDHIGNADARGLERLRTELHRQLADDAAHYARLSHARDSAQLAGNRGIGDTGERRGRQRIGRQCKRDDRLLSRVEALDDRLFHLGREITTDA